MRLGTEKCCFNFGENSSQTYSNFSRVGQTAQQRSYTLPGETNTGLYHATRAAMVPRANRAAEDTWSKALLDKAQSSVPGVSLLQRVQDLNPTDFTGSQALSNIVSRNPFSQDYENGTQQLFNRFFNQARAQVQSGPNNVRGGTARTGFELGEMDAQQAMNRFRDVRQQQNREAEIVSGAVQLANTIEQMRRGLSMSAQQAEVAGEGQRAQQGAMAANAQSKKSSEHMATLQMMAELLGLPTLTQRDALFGSGQQIQTGSQFGVGLLSGILG